MNVKHEYKEFNQTRDYYKKISDTTLAYLELDKGPGSNEGSYEATEKTTDPKGKDSDQEEPPEPETQSSHVSSEEEDEQTETEADDIQSGPTDIEDLGSDTSEKEEREEFYTPGTTVKEKGFFDNLIADRKLMNEASHLAKGDYCLLYTSPSPRDRG